MARSGTRVVWHPAAWRDLVGDDGFQSDVTERAERVARQVEQTASDTAYVATDSDLTRKSKRARAAVIASDVPQRRDATYQALLAALDAGR